MPAELAQSLPRHTQMDKGCKLVIFLCTSLFWTVGSLLLLMAFLVSHSVAQLKATGVDTVAVITRTATFVPSRGGDREYLADYIFVPQTNTSLSRSYTGKAGLSASEFSMFSVGDTVVVTYDPRSPDYSRLKSEVRWAHPYTKFFITVGFLVPIFGFLPMAVLLYVRSRYLRQRKLVRWGSVATAIITAEREVGFGSARRTRIIYEFRDQAGKLVTGNSSNLPSRRNLKNGYGLAVYAAVVGNPVVLYDPNDSSQKMLYPLSIVSCLFPTKGQHHA